MAVKEMEQLNYRNHYDEELSYMQTVNLHFN